jgi:hypothetical protein
MSIRTAPVLAERARQTLSDRIVELTVRILEEFIPDMHFGPRCDKKFSTEWETLIAP